jgi:hypothetical protein
MKRAVGGVAAGLPAVKLPATAIAPSSSVVPSRARMLLPLLYSL